MVGYIRKKIKNISNKEWVTLISLAAAHIATPLLLGSLDSVTTPSAFEDDDDKINVMLVVSNTLQTGIAMVLFHELGSAMATIPEDDKTNEE